LFIKKINNALLNKIATSGFIEIMVGHIASTYYSECFISGETFSVDTIVIEDQMRDMM
jgi:hypothetical protein